MAADTDHSKSLSYPEFSKLGSYLKGKGQMHDDERTGLMLKVWELINESENNHMEDGLGDDDANAVISPDIFAITCFQNGLYVSAKDDVVEIITRISQRDSGPDKRKRRDSFSASHDSGFDLEQSAQGDGEGTQQWTAEFQSDTASGHVLVMGSSEADAEKEWESLSLEDIHRSIAQSRQDLHLTQLVRRIVNGDGDDDT